MTKTAVMLQQNIFPMTDQRLGSDRGSIDSRSLARTLNDIVNTRLQVEGYFSLLSNPNERNV